MSHPEAKEYCPLCGQPVEIPGLHNQYDNRQAALLLRGLPEHLPTGQ